MRKDLEVNLKSIKDRLDVFASKRGLPFIRCIESNNSTDLHYSFDKDISINHVIDASKEAAKILNKNNGVGVYVLFDGIIFAIYPLLAQ